MENNTFIKNKGKPEVYITDVFWDRIFLNIVLETENIEIKEIYLVSKKNKHKINLNKYEDNKYIAILNITNIDDGNMLENDDYYIKIQKNDKYETITITTELGYKLENLDRIYRYCQGFYAYTINFETILMEHQNISFVLKSRYMMINKNPKKHCRVNQDNKIKNYIQNIFKNLSEPLLKTLYKVFSILHFNKKNKILLMSETRSPISGNLKALDERLKERKLDKTYKISYSFSKTLEDGNFKLMMNWFKLIWLISKQAYIFVDDYSPLFKFINLSKKTKLIQLWHAGVGFKSVGYARFGFNGPEPYNSCHRKYDYAVVGSKNLIPVYQEVFGISKEKILPYGLPRLDNYLEEERINSTKQKLYDKYPELKDKKIILFAPTFRGKDQKEAYYPYENLELDKIFSLCNEEDYMFIIKMHPFVKKQIEIPKEYQTRIKDFTKYENINDLFYITEILITDYSSNIYDFSLLNKPIIIYAFDLDEYQILNKIQRPVKKYSPGKVCNNFEEVYLTIKNKDFCMDKLEKYRNENFDNRNLKSSDLIIDNIILKGEKDDNKNTNILC